MRQCEIADCGKPAHSRGWCRAHYMRWWKRGGVDVLLPTGRPELAPTYGRVHARLKYKRGSAKRQTCRCGVPAAEWAYDRTDPHQMTERRGKYIVPFSADLARYVPPCKPCHHRFDRESAR